MHVAPHLQKRIKFLARESLESVTSRQSFQNCQILFVFARETAK